MEILTILAHLGITTFFIVGDPEQSIYRFAGADPALMVAFSDSLGATEFSLSGNFRSSTPVVECAERLSPRVPEMFAAGDAAAHTEVPGREHVDNYFVGITEAFLPMVEGLGIPLGETAVLCQNWFQLLPLGRQLRNFGIPVIGPGARPYRKRHLFVELAEQVCAYVDHPNPELVPQAERELFRLVQNATGKPDFRVFSFDGRRTVFRLLRTGKELREVHEGAVEWLEAAALAFSSILIDEGFLPAPHGNMLPESVADMVRDMERQPDVDVPNLTTADLGMFASPQHNMKLLTMHGAKGREFGAVALISLHDGRVPYHNKYNPLTPVQLDDSRRLLYVAITRAKRLLFFFTEEEDWRPISRFLGPLGLA